MNLFAQETRSARSPAGNHSVSTLDLSRDAIAVLTPDGAILYWNGGATRMFGYSAEEALGRDYGLLISPESAEAVAAARLCTLDEGHWEGELAGFDRRGRRLVMLSRWQVEYDARHQPQRILVSGTDIRLWGRFLDQQATRSHQSFDSLFEQHPDGVVAFDLDGRVAAINPASSAITGYDRDELVAMPLSALVERRDLPALQAAFQGACEGRPQSCEFTCIRRDGSRLDAGITLLPNMLANRVLGVYGYLKDISERKQNERRILYLANHDALTGLPNRNLLHDRMEHAIEQARRLGSSIGVLFMDLDRFKLINDSLGHDKGDELLRAVAMRLKDTARAGDTVARIGGDEFVVMLENIHGEDEVRQLATLLLGAVAKPQTLEGHRLSVSTSIGASLYPQDGEDAVTLLKNAGLAMYTGKEAGAGLFRFYEPAMNDRAQARLGREHSLRQAIEGRQLVVHYQPRLDVARNTICALEALVRWQHPDKGLIYPSQFIELAEETGMIADLGEWVVGEACRQMREWIGSGLPPVKVSVNISAQQLRSDRICTVAARALEQSSVAPNWLELEITESSLMENLEASRATLEQFQRMGIALSIDDFGTGYSSLAYLKRLPIDTLKIDKSFVRDLAHDDDDAAIVSATIAMAHRMQLRVVAEGVVSAEQLHRLTQMRCDEIQGYLLCQPLPAHEAASFLHTCRLRGISLSWEH